MLVIYHVINLIVAYVRLSNNRLLFVGRNGVLVESFNA